MPRFLLSALLIASVGCDVINNDDTDLDTNADTGADTDTGTDADTDAGTDSNDCDNNGFSAGIEEFTYLTGYNAVFYTPVTRNEAPYDGLNLELYFDLGAVDTAHTHTFQPGDTLQDCHTCLTIASGCTDTSTCERQFLATGGELVVTTLDAGDGGTFAGQLNNVTLEEVTVDSQGNSSIVTGGQNWCIDGFSFNGTLE